MVGWIPLLGTLMLTGGGPTNVLVLHNLASADSGAVAAYYADARSIPAEQLCGIEDIDPTAQSMIYEDFATLIRPRVDACLADLPYPDDIDYLVLAPGFPRVVLLPNNGYTASLSAMLQIHHTAGQVDGVELAGAPQDRFVGEDPYPLPWLLNPEYLWIFSGVEQFEIQNPASIWYIASVRIVTSPNQPASFRRAAAQSAGGYVFADNLFIVTRLEGFDVQDAYDLVDRGVAADGTFPAGEHLCMEGADPARAARDPECHYASKRLAEAGFDATYLAPHDPALAGRTLSSYFTGASNLRDGIEGNTFLPGAIACNLTSFGAVPPNFVCTADGKCPANESQTSVVRFVRAGATGVHGAVAEPKNSCFPNAGTLLLYTFGYNLGESYFFNQRYLYWQSLYLGDPLTTPYASRPVVTFEQVDTHVEVQAEHPDGISRLRIYVDGSLVSDDEGQPLGTVILDGEPGDTVEVMAIAHAVDVPVDRPGWPVEVHYPKPDVQGWATASFVVPTPPPPSEPAPEPAQAEPSPPEPAQAEPPPVAPEPSPSPDPGPEPTADAPADSDGGCSASPRGSSELWWLALLLLAVFALRRPVIWS